MWRCLQEIIFRSLPFRCAKLTNVQGPMAFWGHPGTTGYNYDVRFRLTIWYVWFASWTTTDCHAEAGWHLGPSYTWSNIHMFARMKHENTLIMDSQLKCEPAQPDQTHSIPSSLWLKHAETHLFVPVTSRNCNYCYAKCMWMNPLDNVFLFPKSGVPRHC